MVGLNAVASQSPLSAAGFGSLARASFTIPATTPLVSALFGLGSVVDRSATRGGGGATNHLLLVRLGSAYRGRLNEVAVPWGSHV